MPGVSMRTLALFLVGLFVTAPATALSANPPSVTSEPVNHDSLVEHLLSQYAARIGAPDPAAIERAQEVAEAVRAFRETVAPDRSDPAPNDVAIGDIWTMCDTWFHSCTIIDPLGTTDTCQGGIPGHWSTYIWVAAPSAVLVGPGNHISWTMLHFFDQLSVPHESGALLGATCRIEFFGLFYTYTTGAAVFE